MSQLLTLQKCWVRESSNVSPGDRCLLSRPKRLRKQSDTRISKREKRFQKSEFLHNLLFYNVTSNQSREIFWKLFYQQGMLDRSRVRQDVGLTVILLVVLPPGFPHFQELLLLCGWNRWYREGQLSAVRHLPPRRASQQTPGTHHRRKKNQGCGQDGGGDGP